MDSNRCGICGSPLLKAGVKNGVVKMVCVNPKCQNYSGTNLNSPKTYVTKQG